jgi:hypothetical protein
VAGEAGSFSGPPDGGGAASTGGNGGHPAAAGHGGKGGAAGKGGVGGESDTGGGGGAAPVGLTFTPIGELGACKVLQATNAAAFQAFSWKACEGLENCEEAVFNPAVLPGADSYFIGGLVQDDGSSVRLGHVFTNASLPHNMNALFFREDGQLLDAFLLDGNTCLPAETSLWGSHYAFLILDATPPVSAWGASVGTFGMGPPTIAPVTPLGFSSHRHHLGESRWAWQWVGGTMSSVSSLDGGGQSTFVVSSETEGILDAVNLTGTGKTFLFEVYRGTPTNWHVEIGASDGIQPAWGYLAPAKGEDVGSPAFAHSHVAWRKGLERKDLNVYGKVELWASPFSEDPAKLTPTKVADLNSINLSSQTLGGWGRVATIDESTANLAKAFFVWNLQSQTFVKRQIHPKREIRDLLGLTRSHLYIGENKPGENQDNYLVRFKLD